MGRTLHDDIIIIISSFKSFQFGDRFQKLSFSVKTIIVFDRFRVDVPTHVVTLTQVGTSVYLGQTHLGTLFQVPAWVRKFSLG